MKKEGGKKKVLGMFLFLIVLVLFFHTYYNLYGLKLPSFDEGSISGKAIFKDVQENSKKLSSNTRMVIILEWLALVSAMLFMLIRAKRKAESEKKQMESMGKTKVHIVKSKSKTDLDVLYEILQQKKVLAIPVISKYFGIDANTAMSWSKILENGNLATIHYPTLGDPKLKLNQE